MWQLQPDITHGKLNAGHPPRVHDRFATWNPITGSYRTRDGRFIHLNMMEGDRYWPDVCKVIGHPELIDDPRFVDMPTRKENARPCVEILDEIFASKDYAEWVPILKQCKGAWAPMQLPLEVHDDPQAAANGYFAEVEMIDGSQLTLVTSPAQFDGEGGQPLRAPELGEHTEQALLGLGLSWDEVMKLKESKAIG
jgi:crotonobetainyl-CoA:carnitine CoA-transferase CaiB-like acyl-CoA transferase